LKFLLRKNNHIVNCQLSIVNCQRGFGALFGAEAASDTFKWYRQIIMIVHKAPQAFAYANQAAYAFVLGQADYPVFGPVQGYGRAHGNTITALITNLNPVIVPIRHHPDGAFFLVRLFKISLGADFFTSTATGTLGIVSNQFFQI